MTDGRKYQPAHRAPRTPLGARWSATPRRLAVPTVAALALGLTGTGVLAAAPAGAADLDTRIERAQSTVERLDRVADQRAARHERARDRAAATEEVVTRLTARIQQQRATAEALRLQLARGVLVEHADGGGESVPVAARELPETSERLLAGVAMVTEDAGATSSSLADAEQVRQQLVVQRSEVRAELRERRTAAKQLGARVAATTAELGAAQERLSGLEAEQAEEASRSAVSYAMAQVGKPYVWGAAGPGSFDCSGLTMAAWATEGVSLPHSSSAQYASGTPVSESELQPGDLVFYYSPISHVGIYVGDGQIVNALNPSSGVQVSGLHDMPYSGAVRPG